MSRVFGQLDAWICVVSLFIVLGIGAWSARGQGTSRAYFLADRSIGFWGVAGSVFATNISANQLVGMLGIGYSVGFAQSHFEFGAVLALLLLAYGFLPVYHRMGLFTLSGYLGARYDARAQSLYALFILVLIMVQLTASFYIGARSLSLMLQGTPLAVSYTEGLLGMAVFTAVYMVAGGMQAVIFTEVVQSLLLLVAAGTIAYFTLGQAEIGGFSGLLAQDALRPAAEQKMHLYLPSNHPDLPWSGALTGLVLMHVFYWSTNQYVVQRALTARTIEQGRLGLILAGFLKLTIPFFCVAGGVAAAMLFAARMPGREIDPDAAMVELIRTVVPAGRGFWGLILAGLLAAILSTLASLVSSASTVTTFDIYQRWIHPEASDRSLLVLGRSLVPAFITLAAVLALATYQENEKGNFFLKVSSASAYFTPGLITAFALGMFWPKASARGAFWATLLSPLLGLGVESVYAQAAARWVTLRALAGEQLNFLHRVFFTFLLCTAVHVALSLLRPSPVQAARFTIAAYMDLPPRVVRQSLLRSALALLALLAVGLSVGFGMLSPFQAAPWAALIPCLAFLPYLRKSGKHFWRNDAFWAALLSALTAYLSIRFF